MPQQQGRSFTQLSLFAGFASDYQRLRHARPEFKALSIVGYLRDDQGLTLEQYVCETQRGHYWPQVEERERSLCMYCGADGDA
jgi:hypothetical protein